MNNLPNMKAQEQALLRLLIGVVPQWYLADYGPHPQSLKLNREGVQFYSQRALTPDLLKLYRWMQGQLPEWNKTIPNIPTASTYEKVTEDVALKWLDITARGFNWNKIIAYLGDLKRQSYENTSLVRNLVLNGKEKGDMDISAAELEKPFAPLASSANTFMRTDRDLRFLSYEEILWTKVQLIIDYKFHPDFLHPVWSQLRQGECSAHLTSRGDIVVMNKSGLLVANRRGRWYIYDVNTFKNCVGDSMGSYRIGCNLFDIVFDLSYKRRGSLLIYDPKHSVLDHVVNRESIIDPGKGSADKAREILRSVIGNIGMDNPQLKHRKKRLFLEIASIDGAVIFDSDQVLAFGALIEPHGYVKSAHGARTAAALSSYHWGGRPIKVSADGDITLVFGSKANGKPDACIASTVFM